MAFATKYPLATRTALISLWLLGLLVVFQTIRLTISNDIFGQDAHAYWLASQGELTYDRRPGQRDAYLYSPAFLALISPIAILPWPAFLALWISLEAALLVWLLKPLPAKWFIPVFLICSEELTVGNIYIVLGCAAVIGMQKPLAWSFPILTKVTTGVGLLWFAARGDWGRLLQGSGGLLVILTMFYISNPADWHAWFEFLLEHKEATPDSQAMFYLRCLLAVALVVLGARKKWPWLVAPAMVLASPVLVGVIPYAMLAAIPRLALLTGQRMDAPHAGLPDKEESSTTR